MTGWTADDVIEAARAVRVYLSQLVPDPMAVDARLAALLGLETPGWEAEMEILDVLRSTEDLRAWTAAFMTGRAPPQISATRTAGVDIRVSSPVSFERFVCPSGDFSWYRFLPGERAPPCPTHSLPLQRAP